MVAKMNSELTEILIGKFIDSEITPAEQRMLDAELKRNPQAQELLDSLRILRDQAQDAMDEQLPPSKLTPADIFEQAWQQSKPQRRAVSAINRYGRWAAAIAVGFLLGSTLQQQNNVPTPSRPTIVYQDTQTAPSTPTDTPSTTIQTADIIKDENPNRDQSANIERYTYSDLQGQQWLIETPVVYAGTL